MLALLLSLERNLRHMWQAFLAARFWRGRGWPVLVWLLTASLGVGMVYWAGVRWGPGATTDGLIYLTVARNLRWLGRAVVLQPGHRWETVTLWPPGYPLSIAGFLPLAERLFPQAPRGLWDPPEAAARAAWLLHMTALAVLLALAVREVHRVTRHPLPTAGLALLVATAFPVLRMYTWVHSETVFLVQMFLAAWSLQAWVETPASRRRAVLTGLLAAWAVAVRWVGVAMVPWMLTVYLTQARGRRDRVALLAFLAAAGLPVAGLVLATVLASGAVTGRTPGWYPPRYADWLRAARTVAEWVQPPFQELPDALWFLRAGMVLAAALGVILAGVWALRRDPVDRDEAARYRAFLFLWSAWVLWYWTVFLASRTVLEPKVELKLRLLVPVYVPLLLLVGVAAWVLVRERWWLVPLVLLAWLHLLRTARAYDDFYIPLWHRRGAAWRTAALQTTDLWPALRRVPPQVAFYTNKWVVVDFYTARPTYPLLSSTSLKDLKETCALFVLVGDPDQDRQVIAWSQTLARQGFPQWGRWPVAVVHRTPNAGCPIAKP